MIGPVVELAGVFLDEFSAVSSPEFFGVRSIVAHKVALYAKQTIHEVWQTVAMRLRGRSDTVRA